MGQKKDIGKLFENKLNDGKKNPGKSLWEKISHSLDMEKRRKKKILFYYLLGGALSILIGAFLLFEKDIFFQSNPSKSEENKSITEHPFSSSEKETEEVLFKIWPKDSVLPRNESAEKLYRDNTRQRDSILKEMGTFSKDSYVDSKNETKKVSAKPMTEKENFTVTKNYYYYNSKNGKQIITTNKKEIDSLISENKKAPDSLNLDKTNSPEQ